MADAKSAVEWFEIIGLGVAFGMAGQGARVIVGLKKLNDEASAAGKSMVDGIEPSRLLVSLLIGAISGLLAATTAIDDIGKIQIGALMALAAAGYAGADFIEGFMSRFLPKSPPAPAPVPNADGLVG